VLLVTIKDGVVVDKKNSEKFKIPIKHMKGTGNVFFVF